MFVKAVTLEAVAAAVLPNKRYLTSDEKIVYCKNKSSTINKFVLGYARKAVYRL